MNEDERVLETSDEAETDYVLKETANSCWITIGDFSVYIQRIRGEDGEQGVAVDIYEHHREAERELASAIAWQSDLISSEGETK